jgi:hypothetical protein
MRSITHVGALIVALALSPLATAQTPPSSAPAGSEVAAKYDENTSFGVLIGDPKAKAVLAANWPVIIDSVEMGGVPNTRTMKQAFESESARTKGGLTDEIYAKIVAELRKL